MTANEQYWLGPTYEFEAFGWKLTAGVPAEEGRLEWLLEHEEAGHEAVSHSFVLDKGAERTDLDAALADLAPEVRFALVEQVDAQLNPRLLAGAFEGGLA